MNTRGWSARLSMLGAIALIAVACSPAVVSSPSVAPTSPTSSLPAVSGLALRPAPEDCEDFDFVPCPRQVARLSIPLAGSTFALTYTSDRVPGRTITPSLDASSIGLGGWSLDVLQAYDTSAGVLVLGTGERRAAQASTITLDDAPALAVPSEDGTSVFVFDAQGRQSRTYDALTGALAYQFTWDTNGLASVTEPGDRVTRIRRDASGQPIEIVSARGYRTRLGTSGGWLAGVADPSGDITHIATSADGLVSLLRDPTGAATTIGYDASGRLTELDGPNGETASYVRTDVDGGFTVAGSTGGGRTWSDTVQSDGTKTVRTHVDFAGLPTTVAVDGTDRTLTTADGTATTFRLTADPRWGLSAPMPTDVVTTSPAGRRMTSSEARTTSATGPSVDPAANTRTMTVDGAAWKFGYDPATRTTTLTQPDGRTRATTLDATGRVVTVKSSWSAVTNYHYDEHGRIDTVTIGEGSASRVWHYVADRGSGDLVVTDPLGQSTTIRADATGRIAAVQAASGASVGLAHGSLGQIEAVTSPSGTGTRTTYRPDGQVDTVTSPAGADGLHFRTAGYDTDGLLAQIGFVDGTGVMAKRDGSGRIVSVDAGAGASTIAYDPTTGAATTFDGPGDKLQRTYDGSGLVSEAWSDPVSTSVTRGLDPAGRVIVDTVAGSPEISYAYDAAGLLVKAGALTATRDGATGLVTQDQIGTLTRTWRYDPYGAVIGATVTSGTTSLYDLTLIRDGLGRVTRRTEHLGGVTHTRAFTYSTIGQLTSVIDDGKTTTYAYDANGNLTLEKAANGSTIKATYDGRDELVARGTTTYTYDVAGRLATETTPTGTATYAYDLAGHLLSVTPPSGPKIEYVLDATGRRIGRKVGGTVMAGFAYLDALRPAAELDGTGAVTERFVYGLGTSAPTYIVRGGKTLLVVVDDTGTPRLLVDAADGSVVEQLQTDALGRTTSDTDPGLQPFGFAGGLADPDTGLLHFGARDYDPSVGRWTAPDPLGIGGGDPNLYRYVGGDPVNRVDPAGLACDVFAVGWNGSVGWGGGVASAGGGLLVGGTDLGLYTQGGLGIGTPGAGSVITISCLDEVPPAPGTSAPDSPLDEYGGEGATSDLSPGIVGAGGDSSYNGDGSTSLTGGHLSLGYQTPGASAQTTGTHVTCLTCWDWPKSGTPAAVPEKDPGSDDPLDGGVCDGPGCNEGSGPTGANDEADGEADGLDSGGSAGEPHLHTADKVRYDFQAAGEFTALRSDSGDLLIQVRQTPLEGSRWVAVNTATAMSVNGDHLSFARTDTGFVVTVNGRPFLDTQDVRLPKGGSLTPEDQSYLVTWPDGSLARVMPYGSGLNLATHLAPGRLGTVHGLLGPDTGKASTSVEAKDGTKIEIPVDDKPDYQALYRTFGESWRITQAESLFDYAAGQSTATFDDRSFPDPNPPPIPADQAAAAQVLCARTGLSGGDLADCVYDVTVTGDAGFAVTDANSLLIGRPTLGALGAGPTSAPPQDHAITIDGPPVSATLTQPGTVVTFTFAGTAGQTIYLTVPSSTLPDDCGALTLRGPDDGLIGSGCIVNGSGSLNGIALPLTGSYTIVFDPQTSAIGDLTLQLSTATDQVGTIDVGGDIVGAEIRQAGATATFTFAGTAGETVTLEVLASTLPDECAALTIHDPDGKVIGSGCIVGGHGTIDGTTLPVAGRYSVVVDPSGSATGTAALLLLR